MAKIECELYGNFDEILSKFHNAVMDGSASASFEDSSYFETSDMRCAVRSYERYSVFGQNRVSLTFTLAQSEGRIFFSAITAGGSQAVFFKFNTVGEETFLNTIVWVVKSYSTDRNQ